MHSKSKESAGPNDLFLSFIQMEEIRKSQNLELKQRKFVLRYAIINLQS
jgi:hypothetical protein